MDYVRCQELNMDNHEDQKKFSQPSWLILVVATVVWFGLIVYFANEPGCLSLSRCDTDDFILFGIIAVGLLVPAGIAAFVIEKLLSGFFDVTALEASPKFKMLGIYLQVAFFAIVIAIIILTSIHSFNVSEKEREDDMTINRYGKD